MAITKAKKGETIQKLEKAFKDAKSLVFVNFHGLNVTDATVMRCGLRGENISYTVAKKSLAKRALAGEKFAGTAPVLEGELGLAWGDDLIAPARGVYVFQKKFPNALKILGGVFDGKYLSQTEMEEVAKIPSLEVLRGKFVNIINSPLQRMAVVLGEIAKVKI